MSLDPKDLLPASPRDGPPLPKGLGVKWSGGNPQTYEEYRAYEMNRQEIISRNRSRRLRGLPLLPQPPKVAPPKKRVVYSREKDGSLTYEGTLREGEDVPEGMVLKLEDY